MKEVEEISTAKSFLIKEGWKEDSSGMFDLNGLSELLEEYKNQFIPEPKSLDELEKIFYDTSSPLLCIEAKVIDEMIENLTAHSHILKHLKSKMTPIDPVKIKGDWFDKGVDSCERNKNTFIYTPDVEKGIQQDKNNYLNGK